MKNSKTNLNQIQDLAESVTEDKIPFGDSGLVERLFTENQEQLRRYALSLCKNPDDAEDVLVDASVRAWQSRANFKGAETFLAWMRKIIKNIFLDRLRKADRRPVEVFYDNPSGADLEGITSIDLPDPTPTPDELVLGEIGRAELLEMIRKMPVKYAKVLEMRLVDELSPAEVGEELALPVATIRSRAHRGTQALRSMIQKRPGRPRPPQGLSRSKPRPQR